jgi:tRNA threonylcarbamoyladenosine biosynthesis protein TsaE
MNHHIENIDTLNLWVNEWITTLSQKKHATILQLSGDLGSGKTTLTQCLGRNLGVSESITSPTFVIQKEYTIDNHAWIKKLIHIDAYRLEKKEDLEYLGWAENIKNPENLIVIEWPEMVSGISMPEVISIDLEINNDHTRTLIIRPEH